MQLKRKQETPQQTGAEPPKYKKAPPIDWSLYEVDYDAVLPYGKYQGHTLGLVEKADERYYLWMIGNNIIAEWALIKLKKSKNKSKSNKQYDPFRASDGRVWLCLYAVKKTTM